jgi:predicted TIM-barrel fold metal-dependent hydrolase
MERKTKQTKRREMTDSHIHIGQFNEVYYEAKTVFEAVFGTGKIDAIAFSSTTSCKDNVKYSEIEKEIDAALSLDDYGGKLFPYFWCVPEYAKQGVSIEKAFGNLPYQGIKIHPHAHRWDFADKSTLIFCDEVFGFATENKLPVLIHTGENRDDSPDKFKDYFSKYASVLFILAHSRPVDVTLQMLNMFPNVHCDTAFANEQTVRTIISAGFINRIRLGSDFPITHYFADKYGNKHISLNSKYQEDVAAMEMYQGMGVRCDFAYK